MKKVCVALIAGLFSYGAVAAGDPEAGKAKAGICAACHGPAGKASIPGYPHIAGQNKEYLANALKAFRSGERKGGFAALMSPMAAPLSDQDIEDLAAYFSTL